MEGNMDIVISMIVKNDSSDTDINTAITREWIAHQKVLSFPLNNEIRGHDQFDDLDLFVSPIDLARPEWGGVWQRSGYGLQQALDGQ